jgi:hypothetical protein
MVKQFDLLYYLDGCNNLFADLECYGIGIACKEFSTQFVDNELTGKDDALSGVCGTGLCYASVEETTALLT